MNNNINISISIENLQATANGCSFDKASINVDSNYGNEIASVLQELLQTAMSKIQTPAPTTTTTTTTTTTPEPEVRRVVEKAVHSVVSSTGDFCEVHEPHTSQVSWDLAGVWKVLTATMPMADFNVDHKAPGFKKKSVGKYVYFDPADKSDNRITFELRDDSIILSINTILFVLREDPKYSGVVGIHTSLIPELIELIPEDIRKVVEGFIEKVLKK